MSAFGKDLQGTNNALFVERGLVLLPTMMGNGHLLMENLQRRDDGKLHKGLLVYNVWRSYPMCYRPISGQKWLNRWNTTSRFLSTLFGIPSLPRESPR